MKKQRIWPVLLAAGIGFCILCGLGVWQVQRLQWKNTLIAEIDNRMSQEPVRPSKLQRVDRSTLEDGTIAKVKLVGEFKSVQLRKISTLTGSVGFEILQGFVTADGQEVLVSRGVISEQMSASTPTGPVEIIALLRTHKRIQGRFDPDNRPNENQWYWWDVPAMYPAAGLRPTTHVNIVFHLLPKSPGTEGLHVDLPKANLRNNHLGYAITWFGLAAALVGVTGAFVFRLRRL